MTVVMNGELKKTHLSKMDAFEKFQLQLLRDASVQKMMQGAPASTAVIGVVPNDQVFEQFFETRNDRQNDEIRKFVEMGIRDGKKKINHVVNTTLGVGFLVPEGYVLQEMLHTKTGGYTLMISRPGSHYKAYVYARRLASIPSEKKKEQSDFNLEVLNFLSDVPEIAVTFEPEPGAGKALIGPGSWPALYRDSGNGHGCLVTFRTYFEPARGSLHTFSMELCHRNNRFEVAGITFPVDPFDDKEPSEEFMELELIAASLYDIELGIEKSKRLSETQALVAELELPTPTPEARPKDFDQQLEGTFPSAPGEGKEHIVLRPPQPPVPQPQPIPPQPPESFAANLGMHFRLVQLPNGVIGALVTRNPPIGSPASQVFAMGLVGSLQQGDIILAIDGVPVNQADFSRHFGETTLDIIDAPTGQLIRGLTNLPIPRR